MEAKLSFSSQSMRDACWTGFYADRGALSSGTVTDIKKETEDGRYTFSLTWR